MEQEYSNSAMRSVVYIEAGMRPLVTKFLNNRRRDVDIISVSLEAGDFETIQQLAHNLKGAGASYGFPFISEIGIALEQAACAKQAAFIIQNVLQLSTYLDCVEVLDE